MKTNKITQANDELTALVAANPSLELLKDATALKQHITDFVARHTDEIRRIMDKYSEPPAPSKQSRNPFDESAQPEKSPFIRFED